MRSLVSPEFRKMFARLPNEVQVQARKAFGLWKENPSHPSIDFKKLKVTDAYSARDGLHYRAVCVRVADETYVWEWVGTHAEYDRLVK